MSKKQNRAKRRASKSGLNRTPLSGHTRVANQLLSPFSKLENVTLTSWANDRLPEMIWAGLILTFLGRDKGLDYFRRILGFIQRHPKKNDLGEVTLTRISKLPDDVRHELIFFICQLPDVHLALAPMRLFESLPAKADWDKFLPDSKHNIDLLMATVGAMLWHQSEIATDCRWLRLMASLVAEKLHFPASFSDHFSEIMEFPNRGDLRQVRPSIRAMEGAQNPLNPPDLTWPKAFWDEAWRNTPCLALVKDKEASIGPKFSVSKISDVVADLKAHWQETHSTTAINAKHDAVFGMAFYALSLLEEMCSHGGTMSILGRLGLRTILEVYVNLKFLSKENSDELWAKWRVYGAGQAKLNALKFDDILTPPKFIDVHSVEQIANEDMWCEYVNINLASWSGKDLRKMSESAGVKDIYDRYYSWTSGFVHGTWGPVRESCFDTCGNPLHRLHRYPTRRSLPDVTEDAVILVDTILDIVAAEYPQFEGRLAS